MSRVARQRGTSPTKEKLPCRVEFYALASVFVSIAINKCTKAFTFVSKLLFGGSYATTSYAKKNRLQNVKSVLIGVKASHLRRQKRQQVKPKATLGSAQRMF